MFRGSRQGKKVKIVNISGGTGGTGGEGGTNGGGGGAGEGPRVKLRIVAGETITKNNKNYSLATNAPSGFRMIPRGDIDLQREIHLDGRLGVASLRRLYSAKILVDRERVDATVAVYQGDGAEEEWRRDIKKYMAVWHPNIVQLYGTITHGNIYATVFHDDLIPVQYFQDLYEHSHFSTTYIHVYTQLEFLKVRDYFWTSFQQYLSEYDCTFLIRRSTGRFCVDLVCGGRYLIPDLDPSHGSMVTQTGLGFLAGENSEAAIIDALPLNHYHEISRWEFSTIRSISVAPSATVNIGSLLHCPSDGTFDDVVEIAWWPKAEPPSFYGGNGYGDWSNFAEPMADGWTRLQSNNLAGTTASLAFNWYNVGMWLSQANHIFTTLQISSDFEDYVLVERIRFRLSVSKTKEAIPPGFLFLCPPHHFRTGECSLKWPECPAYWSLDPSGTERLTLEEATGLGFPSFQLSTEVEGVSWDASVYAGLRQFHKGKGFDPDSQELARHLGHKLYQLSGQNRTETLFAHVGDEYSDNADNGGSASVYSTNDAPNHDLASPSPYRNVVEELVSNAGEELVDSTCTDHVGLPIASVHQEAEKIPVSSPFKLVLHVQLSLIFLAVFFWVLSDM